MMYKIPNVFENLYFITLTVNATTISTTVKGKLFVSYMLVNPLFYYILLLILKFLTYIYELSVLPTTIMPESHFNFSLRVRKKRKRVISAGISIEG